MDQLTVTERIRVDQELWRCRAEWGKSYRFGQACTWLVEIEEHWNSYSDDQRRQLLNHLRRFVEERDPPQLSWHHGFQYSVAVMLVAAKTGWTLNDAAVWLMDVATRRPRYEFFDQISIGDFLQSVGMAEITNDGLSVNPTRILASHLQHEPVVYFLANDLVEKVKIGFTTNIYRRIRTLQTAGGCDLDLIALEMGGRELEAMYHEQYAAQRGHGEWFDDSDQSIAIYCDLLMNRPHRNSMEAE